MGLVSLSEDIDELRQENEAHMRGLDNLIKAVRNAPDLGELTRAEAELKELAGQLIAHFEKVRSQAKKTFEEAMEYLRDPNVMITAKLDKRTKQRDEARKELAKYKAQLESSRSSQSRSKTRISELEREVKDLKKRKGELERESEKLNRELMKYMEREKQYGIE